MIWTRKKLIESYLKFFKEKGHAIIPSAQLIPENDPTVLFTTAGMHPLVPYLLGQPHSQGKKLVDVQKCLRTGDIESVGDTYHHTFFEMLGNWSLGDYFKKEAIAYSFEFLTKVLKIPLKKLAVTCFAGDKDAGKDEEAFKVWKSLGIPNERIKFLGKEDNWWGPAGKTGPCGPDSEIFIWQSSKPAPKNFEPKDKTWVEIWNDVFMQYNKDDKAKYLMAKQKNIDTGMGVERTIAALNGIDDNYMTELFLPIIKEIEKISGEPYKDNKKEMRIIADHVKAAVFILAEKIQPSNTEHGYVLRRLIRRAVRYGKMLDISQNFMKKLAEVVIEMYAREYTNLNYNIKFILEEIDKEESRFKETLEQGLKIFSKIASSNKEISGKDAFLLYQSYGFPIEMTQELAAEKKLKVDIEGYQKEYEKHQELSRTAAEGRFKSGLADASEQTTRLHTATHMLNQALKVVLKKSDLHQKGSNITSERLRFDFNFDRKLTPEEIQKIESLVNKKIKAAIPVQREEMTLEQAKLRGAHGVFDSKYGAQVIVYSIADFSKEICAGPHVKNTRELGHFKIIKEEGIAAGVRRIKAVLE
jgi:alanyl-tRNA synthetase